MKDEEPIWPANMVAVETQSALSERMIGLLARFARHVGRVAWFRSLGDPLTREEARAARTFLTQLGYPEVTICRVADFEAAAIAAESLDRDAAAWEDEEQLRASLTEAAFARLDPDLLSEALRQVQASAGQSAFEAVENAGAMHAIEDEDLLNAAAGAAVRASHLAALVLAAGEGDDHPFAHKFRLFEMGRWPIAIIGATLHLF